MIAAISIASALLLVGLVVRQSMGWFASARIPVSLIAGAIGLLVWQTCQFAFPSNDWVQSLETGPIASLRQWPGWLIAVVFAGMLLAKTNNNQPSSSHTESGGGFSPVAREGLMVWIIVLGQTTVGLWVTWLFIQPWFELPNSTAMLIETGFAGGHGTAAAMGTVLQSDSIGLVEGLDLGILMATAGLVYGLIAGMVCIHIGIRAGWTARTETSVDSEQTGPVPGAAKGVGKADVPNRGTTPMGVARVNGDAMDPLLLQIVWIALAFGIGVGLQAAVGGLAGVLETWGPFATEAVSDDASRDVLRGRLSLTSIVGSFPLFIYTLFGGAIVRALVVRTAGAHWIDSDSITRLSGTSMDLLVVAAVSTLNLEAVASLWLALLILLIAGIVWSTFCLLVLSRKILPREHWFELGLINFGMSTGTTATGFVLLRVIDPDLRTKAAEHYALAAPLSAPFIGGGMLTVGLPLLLLERVPIAVSAIGMTAIQVVLIGLAIRWKNRVDHEDQS
ncbi:glutamate:Na+ symporter, ESS family [Neorhodopirellula lusitana]|uniref:Glutamate:Na+ symporter, ESS family n=1 Tax=Neorhodopirellula lusitana TaxID=445327 RepID=A0ABY1PQ14_9BACT|nr:sodium:glutamate symporter [Neorhodopirellula lusitana]SMP41965.1 glutamate:Na+ symporter, ESS family [Neorhodopirellula lusitana]